jgi:predicted methyltransferase
MSTVWIQQAGDSRHRRCGLFQRYLDTPMKLQAVKIVGAALSLVQAAMGLGLAAIAGFIVGAILVLEFTP